MTDVDSLFEVEPGEFVKARDELAARLKKEGRSDEAAEVRKLRRPSVVIFELNRLARRRPDDVVALLDAGEEVRRIQQKGGGPRLREATRNVQALAKGLAAGTARPTEVDAALRAAALGRDPDGELRAGLLTAVPQMPVGPEMWVAGGNPKRAEDTRRAKEREQAQAEQAKAEAEVERARSLVADAEELLARHRASLDEAESRLREVKRRR